ncbi:DUF2306 domain-containing protein [Bacillus taeanensis]|uniref:DUF2306 domain-containing protein n=1 Tax=Bacillus taeanensis TaxID=273032 RepID=A0A366Y3D9_9BACI|nr:DUF2306 domain-containing protein [Bacillus taeanensis]RBW70894.1 DUF2306 domain-containing protein [Bacillus taeanensis]
MLEQFAALCLGVHIFAGFLSLIIGLFSMVAPKRKGKHTMAGKLYHGLVLIVCVTAVIMAILHWDVSSYLFYIALFSYAFAFYGYNAGKRKYKGWLSHHISGMLGSYIAMVTALLVVNQENIPLLNELPSLFVWFFPTIIGSPIIAFVTRKTLKVSPKTSVKL